MVYKCFEPPPYLHAFHCLLPKHRVNLFWCMPCYLSTIYPWSTAPSMTRFCFCVTRNLLFYAYPCLVLVAILVSGFEAYMNLAW
jgi:hypothetical protein